MAWHSLASASTFAMALALAVPALRVATQEARAILPPTVDIGRATGQAARAAALVAGLARGDGSLIRFGMEDCIAVPRRKHLVPGFDAALEAGCEAGAYNVTLSGSGSTVLAISPRGRSDEVAGAMCEALHRNGSPAQPMAPDMSERGFLISKLG